MTVRWRLGLIGSLVAVSVLMSICAASSVSAADARNFNAGRIIDDAVFTNSDSMSVQQIQQFLESKVSCDTWGQKRSELGGGSRAQWMNARGISAPFRCITDYAENPNTGENNYSKQNNPAGAVSAAQLIHVYAKQFDINPQVLIATLQKENSLITDEWPTPKQFREAVGFGCPDHVAPGAPACDPAHGSFSAQLYQAARHFRGYMERRPGWFVPYSTGWNKIMWNPNGGCGTSDVYIENRATAALYSYTPYRPNQAALNAQYGTGDGCSSYGNRNFYLFFSDWFGSTHINGHLLRTVDNATVYLVGKDTKYPIASMETLSQLSAALGSVSFVSQSYLDTYLTGQLAGRLIRSEDGTIYFYDSGIKLPFTSCDMVAQYGLGQGCGQPMQLTNAQVNRFYSGPPIMHGYKTVSGKRFYIENGSRREVLDDQSLAQAQRDQGYNVLSDSAIQYLPIGEPIVRDSVVIESRSGGNRYLVSSGQAYSIKRSMYVDRVFNKFNSGILEQESIAKLPQSGKVIDDHIANSTGTQYLITGDGKKQIVHPGEINSTPTVLSDQIINQLDGSGSLESPIMIKSADNGTVYVIESQQKRPIVSMDDVFAILGKNQPYIAWVSGGTLASIPSGNVVFAPGKFVKSPSNDTVYVSDGYDKLLPLSHFQQAFDVGVEGNIRTVRDDVIGKYKVSESVLSPYVNCGGVTYLGVGGVLYKIELSNQRAFSLQLQTCKALRKEDVFPTFISDGSGTIFYVKDGEMHPIRSWQTFLSLNRENKPIVRGSFITTLLMPQGLVM